ncbi:MAG: SHOCT domain-containing protein [Planctomycetota bacterium]
MMIAQTGTNQVLFWIAVLIVLVLIAGTAVLILRRKLFGGDNRGAAQPGGILESLREMRDRGEMSGEEFEQARAAVIRKASGRAQPDIELTSVDERKAQTGFDLTGDPLPDSRSGLPSESRPDPRTGPSDAHPNEA